MALLNQRAHLTVLPFERAAGFVFPRAGVEFWYSQTTELTKDVHSSTSFNSLRQFYHCRYDVHLPADNRDREVSYLRRNEGRASLFRRRDGYGCRSSCAAGSE